MRNRIFVLLSSIVIFMIGANGVGQQAFFRVHTLTAEINNGNLQTILQDKQGFIWLGTSTGLYRFDGINYILVPADDSLRNISCSALFQASDGIIWAGTHSGHIARMIQGKLELFEPEEGHPRAPIMAITQDSHGNIWFATYGEGVYCFTNNRLYNFNNDDGLSDNFTYTIAADKQGNIWAGTDGGISICSMIRGKKTVRLITSANGLPDNIVLKISPDHGNNMWIGMQDGGICAIDAKTHRIQAPSQLSKWAYGPVNDMAILGDRIWAGTDDHGVVSIDLKSPGHVQTYSKMGGGNYLKFIKLTSDLEGNVWFLTNKALIQSPGAKLEILSTDQDKSFSNIHSILCDKGGDLWYSNDYGLYHYQRGMAGKANPLKVLSLQDYKGMKIISLYQDREGYIWIGTFGNGILRLNPWTNALTRYSSGDGLANDNVLSITGVESQIWFATLGGASRCILPSTGSVSTAKLAFEGFGEANGLGNNFIYSVFADSKKRIWFATDGKGITVRENGTFRNYSEASGLKSKVVYSITEDKNGHIWFSTSNAGLFAFDGKTFRNYGLHEGLSDLAITSLTAVKSSKVFIVHSKGIDILDQATGKFNYLGEEEGIGDINSDLNALTVDYSNDLVWIGTSRGIIKLAADEYTRSDLPRINLDKVLVFLTGIDTLKTHIFPYNQNHFSFDYVGLWFKAPERVRYQVMLTGHDLDWITTKNTSVIYSSLAPGSYTFMVRASINDDFSGAVVKNYHFLIRKPIWKTAWFISVLLLIAGISIYRYIRDREKRLRREENLQKEKIVFQFETLKSQVNPHFLFNSFSTLSAIIDEDKEMALDYVQKLSAFFRNILEYRDKTVITLREELALADTYYYLQQKRYGANFSLLMDIPEAFLETYIPPMTLQMILENAVKYNVISAEKPLAVSIRAINNYLVISNHIQVKTNLSPSTGIGIQNIQNRYRLLIDKDIVLNITAETYTISLPIIKSLSK